MNSRTLLFYKDSKLKGVGDVFAKKYHPRRSMFSQDPYFADESKPQRSVWISERCSQTSNNLEDQWIWKTTLLLRNGNLKGGTLETSKTEGEIFTKNVVDGSRYWKPTLMMKKSMPQRSMKSMCEELAVGASF